MGFEKPLSGAERVAKRRAALRAQGLKPKTIWLPDVKSAAFNNKAQRSCQWLWDRAPFEEQEMAWVDAMIDDVLIDLDRRDDELKRETPA